MSNAFANPWGKDGEYWKQNAVHESVLSSKEIGQNGSTNTLFHVVRNFSNYIIWCKNENDSNVFQLKPNEKTNSRIDGLTHPTKPGEVFKVVTIMMDLFGLDVYNNGIAFQSAFWPFDKDLNELGNGGWLSSAPDPTWNLIFEKAN